jgi:hypothetical protein
MAWIRGHWQVENCLHFIKDRWWDEDRHYLRRPGLAERLAALTDAALTALRLSGQFSKGDSIRARAEQLCWRPRLALKLLGVGN